MASRSAIFLAHLRVKSMTRVRRGHVVVAGGVCLLAGVMAGCGDSAPTGQDSWTARPPALALTNGGDGGFENAADAEEPEVPEVLCTLAGPPATTAGDVLVFNEDFTGTTIDQGLWTVADGIAPHGTMSNSSEAANATVKDGSLLVVSDRAPAGAAYPYVSGRLDGKFARTFGKVEFRARFPFAGGTWAAVWARPWSKSYPEIDFELINPPRKTTTDLYFVNHWAGPPIPADERRSFELVEGFDGSDFHTYTLLWQPELLEYRVDGVTKMQAKPQGIPESPIAWIINGWVGGWVGEPTLATPFPTTLEVDYLRVYRVDGLIADPVVKIFNPNGSYAAGERIEIGVANVDEACTHVEMYDGERMVKRISTRPFRFSLNKLGAGPHTLTFRATDGVRTKSASFDTQIQ